MTLKIKSKSASKSYLDRVVFAIRSLKQYKGSSRKAISNYIESEFAIKVNTVALRNALKKGVAAGLLSQDKQSFKVAMDSEYLDTTPSCTINEEVIGTGDAAVEGSTVTVKYRGTLEDSGEQFDAANKFTFVLGAGDVIKGWDQGIIGMKVGGRRRLKVPPTLGYGKKGSGSKNVNFIFFQFQIYF
eukprot:GSMAST32.ASY1.ANO1.2259.1 assembled CDS